MDSSTPSHTGADAPVSSLTKSGPDARSTAAAAAPPPRRPDARDPILAVQREALKCALQEPALVSAWYASVEPEAYPDPTLRSVHEAIAGAGGPRPELVGLAWVDAVLAACPDDEVRGRVRGLAVEPLPVSQEADARYATSVIARLLEMDAARRIGELRGRLQRLEDLQSVEYQKRNETNEIFIPPGERLGDKVIEFKNVSKSFGDRLLIDDLNITIPPGAIVGIIGPNGAGKSTLFKMITGKEAPDSGSIDIGPTRHGLTHGKTIYFFDPSGNRNEVFCGGDYNYQDHKPVTWLAKDLGKAIFYHDRVLNERFLTVLT